jgi:hypothetical protein
VERGICAWHPEPHATSHQSPHGWRTHYLREWDIHLASSAHADNADNNDDQEK